MPFSALTHHEMSVWDNHPVIRTLISPDSSFKAERSHRNQISKNGRKRHHLAGKAAWIGHLQA